MSAKNAFRRLGEANFVIKRLGRAFIVESKSMAAVQLFIGRLRGSNWEDKIPSRSACVSVHLEKLTYWAAKAATGCDYLLVYGY